MTEALLQSLIASNWRAAKDKGLSVEAIGVRSESRWQGPDRIAVDGETMPVCQCDSPLHFREMLSRHDSDAPIILITPLPLSILGTDVEARLLRHRLLEVEPWDLLRSRFRAKSFDPSLHGKTALAKAAVEALGVQDPVPCASGVLTAEAAWKVVLGRYLGLREARPDLRAWLEWARDSEHEGRWKALPAELKPLLAEWLHLYLPETAPALLACLDATYGTFGLAFGFVLAVLGQKSNAHPSEDQRALDAARIRLQERFWGGQRLSASAEQSWIDACEQWASAMAMSGQYVQVSNTFAFAEGILNKIEALEYAAASKWLGSGLQAQLQLLAEGIDKSAGTHEADLARIEEHFIPRWSKREGLWLERARMAVRLVRWLATPESEATNWPKAVEQYQRNGSWIDSARQMLMTGDEPETVGVAWRALLDRVTQRRERENATFAKWLADATQRNATGDGGIPIEQIVDRVVTPWAKDRVLLIVMDGMSFAVWRELQPEIEGSNWISSSLTEGQPLPAGVAALPCVTTVSRCSLLCGRLAEGGQEAEKRGFGEHASLLAVSKSGAPPVLYHKDEVGAGVSNIAESVRRELRNPNRRVVGVVINVIDDSLSGPEQRVFRWSLDQIPILRTLLDEAQNSDRTVIITADHGHVLDRGAVMKRKNGSDRHRAPDGILDAGELLVQGSRVVTPTSSVVCLTGEPVRYTAVRKLGYHGGLTPQECLVPILALAPSHKLPEGWFQSADPQPTWWYPDGAAPPSVRPAVRKAARGKSKTTVSAPLLDGLAALDSDWVQALLHSEVLQSQMQIAGGRLDAGKVEEAVRVLAQRNGVLLKSAFASQVNLPLFRIDGFLSNLQRVLNVDGYQVLSIDASQTVRLDIALLKTQFALPLGD